MSRLFSFLFLHASQTVSAIVQPFPGSLEGRLSRIARSAGVLLPGVQARIICDDGSDADFEEPGELLLKGSMVALGYWNNEKANKETFIDGWLHTGDRFSIDRKGNLYALVSLGHDKSSDLFIKFCRPSEGLSTII